MCLAETDSFLAGLERETDHFELAVRACAEALGITNKERQQAVPNSGWHKINFHSVVESARLAARTGESLSSRASALRTLLQELEEKTPGGQLTRADRRLARSRDTSPSRRLPQGAAVCLKFLRRLRERGSYPRRATPRDARTTPFEESEGHDRDDARVHARRRRQKRKRLQHAAERAVAILEKLAALDPSYSYDLACALALQARLEPGHARSAIGRRRCTQEGRGKRLRQH